MTPCISILQPYAWLVVHRIKPVENRTWATKFRGRILIHAGKNYPKGEYADDAESFSRRYGKGYPRREDMIGRIVGEATITDCATEHPSEWFNGPYGFVLADAVAFEEPIPMRGMLGIFGVTDSAVLAAVQRQRDRALYLRIKAGRIVPAPIKVGREYKVDPEAKHIAELAPPIGGAK